MPFFAKLSQKSVLKGEKMIVITQTPDEITINGHAHYAQPGHDIVCAAVSILVQNLIYSTYKLIGYEMEVTETDGYISSIKCKDIRNMTEIERALLNSFFIGLEMIEEAHPQNIRVKYFMPEWK